MIDTIVFEVHMKLDIDQLKSVGFRVVIEEYSDGNTKRRLYFNTVIAGAPFGFTYYPPNPGFPNPMLLIKISLPNVLSCSNALMLISEADVQAAASKANALMHSHFPWLAPIDVSQLVIQRIDLMYDHPVGKWVQDYLRVLQQQTMPNRKTFPFVERDFPEKIRLQGVEYRTLSGHNKASFYDKWLECKRSEAAGILRQERKICEPRTIGAQFGIIEKPTLQHVTIDRVTRLLESDLEKLGLKDTVITDLKTSAITLLDTYGFPKAARLIGYLDLIHTMGKDELLIYSKPSTIWEYEKAISDAGVSIAVADENVTLPPLRIQF